MRTTDWTTDIDIIHNDDKENDAHFVCSIHNFIETITGNVDQRTKSVRTQTKKQTNK